MQALEDRRLLATFSVTSNADSGAGSLRQAIVDANGSPGADTINFSIGGGGFQAIALVTDLPTITESVVIDGQSQPGWSGSPIVEVTGGAGLTAGLSVSATNTTIRGLAIGGFTDADAAAIRLSGTGHIIQGNYLGMTATGVVIHANYRGLELTPGTSANLIGTNADGTNDAAEGNLISGNLLEGIWVDGASGNVIAGNLVGTNFTGMSAAANQVGILLSGTAESNTIGGVVASAANVVSGNTSTGIWATGGATSGNVIAGNKTGVAIDGTTALANGGYALAIDSGDVASVQGTFHGDVFVWGTLDLGGQTTTVVGSLVSDGTVTNFGSSTGTLVLNGSSSFAGTIADGGAATTALVVAGGTVTLTGANTYSGGTQIQAGTLRAGSNTALGSTSSNISIANGAVLDLWGFDLGAHSITASGRGTGSGAITNSSGTPSTLAASFSTSSLSIGGSGQITITGAINGFSTLTKVGLNRLVLGGTEDNAGLTVHMTSGILVLDKTSSSGVHAIGAAGLYLEGGTVQLAGTGNDQIYDGSAVNLTSGLLDLNGTSEAASLVGTGGFVDNTAAATTSTFWLVNNGGLFGGVLRNTGGTLALGIDLNSNTQILTGANTYSGGTTISSGTLQIGNGGSTGSWAAGQ